MNEFIMKRDVVRHLEADYSQKSCSEDYDKRVNKWSYTSVIPKHHRTKMHDE